MLFILRFINNPDKVHLVPQYYPAHVEWLKQREASILIPGAIRTDPDSPPVGGLWIVRAESKSEVEELFKTDPFWVQGLRQGYEIYYWSKAFPDKTVPLYYIAIIRIMVGYHFAQTSWGKLNADFYTGKRLLAQLANVAADPIALHREFIQEIVIPHAVVFSYIVAWGEFLIGLSLIAGCLTRVSAAFAWFHNLNIYLAIGIPNGGAQLAINRLYLVIQIIFILTAAGRSLGLDRLLNKRFPKAPWF